MDMRTRKIMALTDNMQIKSDAVRLYVKESKAEEG